MPYANKADKAANDKKTYARRRELAIRRERERQLADPEGYKARMRAYYEKRGRDKNYQALYGITLDDYNAMLSAQSGKCAICGTDKPSPKRKNFAVDHCHTAGDVRGLLCIACNSNLGWFERNKASILGYLGDEEGN